MYTGNGHKTERVIFNPIYSELFLAFYPMIIYNNII